MLIPLISAIYSTVATVGSKAMRLSEMMHQESFNIPNGIVLPSERLHLFLCTDANMINNDLGCIDVYSTITDELGCLPFPLIVRSSGDIEDTTQSFAGIFESYVCNNELELLDAFRQMACLVESERFTMYAKRFSINPTQCHLAALIQRFIESGIAGVAFTAHPLTMDRSIIYTEYTTEADQQAIEAGRSVVFKSVSFDKAGVPCDKSSASEAIAVPDKLWHELRSCCLRIEKMYGVPQDIEWRWAEDKLWIVQTRPITTFREIIDGRTC